MNFLTAIRVQKLFLVAVILKVASSFFGWYLGFQWSLGFVLPISVMAAYVAIGLKRKDRDVTDEKFADSCYYLGFIFTITSIVFSLFDLPQIGDRIQDIAVRFGAAMVSTVFGLIVRVYLVSFRPDTTDALKDAEDAVLEAAHKFREQLTMAYEKLNDFQGEVMKATQTTVEGVQEQVQRLSQDHSSRLEQLFLDMNARHQSAVTEAFSHTQAGGQRMAVAMDGYISSMKVSLQGLESRVGEFAAAVTSRLKTTTFPDDYFSKTLVEPVQRLRAATELVAGQVNAAATEASEASSVLAGAIRKLKTKVTQADNSMEALVRMAESQDAMAKASAAQLDELKRLGESLDAVKSALVQSTAAMSGTLVNSREMRTHVDALVASFASSQTAFTDSLSRLRSVFEMERTAAGSLAGTMGDAVVSNRELLEVIRDVSAKFGELSSALGSVGSISSRMDQFVESVAGQQVALSKLSSAHEFNL